MPAINQIEFRRGTAAQWAAANPVLSPGEPGYETDTHRLRMGDGSTAWNSLAATLPTVGSVPRATGDATGVGDRTLFEAAVAAAQAAGGGLVKATAGQVYVFDCPHLKSCMNPSSSLTTRNYAVQIPSNVYIDLNGSTVQATSAPPGGSVSWGHLFDNATQTSGGGDHDLGLVNGIIDGNNQDNANHDGVLKFAFTTRLKLQNLYVRNCHNAGFYLYGNTYFDYDDLVADTIAGAGFGGGQSLCVESNGRMGRIAAYNVSPWPFNVVNYPGNGIVGSWVNCSAEEFYQSNCTGGIKIQQGTVNFTLGRSITVSTDYGQGSGNSGTKIQQGSSGYNGTPVNANNPGATSAPERVQIGQVISIGQWGYGLFAEGDKDCQIGSYLGINNARAFAGNSGVADLWIDGLRTTIGQITSINAGTIGLEARPNAQGFTFGEVVVRNPNHIRRVLANMAAITVAAGSSGQTLTTTPGTLLVNQLPVGLPPQGTFTVGGGAVNYTGLQASPAAFTGATAASNVTVATGNAVTFTTPGTVAGIQAEGLSSGSIAYAKVTDCVDPPLNVNVLAVAGGGTFSGSQTAFYRITYVNASGETLGSFETSVTPAASGSASLTWGEPIVNPILPYTVTGVNIYRSFAAGGQTAASSLVASLGPVTSWTDTNVVAGPGSLPTVGTASTGAMGYGINPFTTSLLRVTSAEISGTGSPVSVAGTSRASQTNSSSAPWLGYIALATETVAGPSATFGGTMSVAGVASGSIAERNLLTATDTQPAFSITGGGQHAWGVGGSTVPDVTLTRSAAGQLTLASAGAATQTTLNLTMATGQSQNALQITNSGGTAMWVSSNGTASSVSAFTAQNTFSSPTSTASLFPTNLIFTRAGPSYVQNTASGGSLFFTTASAVARTVTDGAMSSTTNPTQLSSATAAFTAMDISKSITVVGAGAAGANLVTTISSLISPTIAVLALGASTTVSGASVTLTQSAINRLVFGSGDNASMNVGSLNLTVVDGYGRIGVGAKGVNTAVGIYTAGFGGLWVAQLSAMPAPTVTVNGTAGSTTYTYWIVSRDWAGNQTRALNATTVSTGNATLSSTNFNAVSWGLRNGVATYDILRTTGGAGIASAVSVATGLMGTSFNDIGAGTSAYTIPLRNTTGDLKLDGKLIVPYTTKFNICEYGAVGDNVTDDTLAVQNAVTAAIAASGTLYIPQSTAHNPYILSSTIQMISAAGGTNPFHMNMESDIAGGAFQWKGGNNTSIFKAQRWSYSNIRNVWVTLPNNQTNVVVWDIDDDQFASTAHLKWDKCIVNGGGATGNSTGCIGWRYGFTNPNDISFMSHDACQCNWNGNMVGGDTALVDRVVLNGNVGWALYGQNTLQNTWTACRASGNANVWQTAGNTSAPGQQANGSCWFNNCGGSFNGNVWQVFSNANTYTMNGGRWEEGHTLLTMNTNPFQQFGWNITMEGLECEAIDGATPIIVEGSTRLRLINCVITGGTAPAPFGPGTLTNYGTNFITYYGRAGFPGAITIEDCRIGAPNTTPTLVTVSAGTCQVEMRRNYGYDVVNGVLTGALPDIASINGTLTMGGLFFPQQAPTASAPTYVKGGMYFDTTLNKLRIGGASAWETVTSS